MFFVEGVPCNQSIPKTIYPHWGPIDFSKMALGFLRKVSWIQKDNQGIYTLSFNCQSFQKLPGPVGFLSNVFDLSSGIYFGLSGPIGFVRIPVWSYVDHPKEPTRKKGTPIPLQLPNYFNSSPF